MKFPRYEIKAVMNRIICSLFSAKQNLVVVEVNLRTPAWRIVEKAICLFDIEVIDLISRFPAVEFCFYSLVWVYFQNYFLLYK